MFEERHILKDIGEGILIPLNKPKKEKVVNNTRPITLLNCTRKILSLIILERIYAQVDNYISKGQSGFRRQRGTADIVWSYRWMLANAEKYETKYEIVAIDMSKAFDCINRTMLLDTLRHIIEPSEHQMITSILTDTNLTARIANTYGEKFETTIGVPQGDALSPHSPILFTIYLEAAFREFREQHPREADDLFNEDIFYADDTDLVKEGNIEEEKKREIVQALSETLGRWNLKVNTEKTEYITIQRNTMKEVGTRKLGNLISSEKDTKSRIAFAETCFNSLNKMWRNTTDISKNTKIKMYNSCITPIMIYNIGSNGATNIKAFDVAQRKHLKRIFGIFYPQIISNKDLYKEAGLEPISITAIRQRWGQFQRVAMMDPGTPARKIMERYFKTNNNKRTRRGRAANTLVSKLAKEAKMIGKKLGNFKDLEDIIKHLTKQEYDIKTDIEKIIEKTVQSDKKLRQCYETQPVQAGYS